MDFIKETTNKLLGQALSALCWQQSSIKLKTLNFLIFGKSFFGPFLPSFNYNLTKEDSKKFFFPEYHKSYTN